MENGLLDDVSNDDDYEEEEDEGNQGETLMRTRTFPRTLTDPLAHVIDYITDTDGEWTRQMLEEYGKIDDKGHDGDIPEQPAFATDLVFWQIVALGLIMGVSMGLAGLCFLNIIDEIPSKWVDTDEFKDPNDGKFYSGKTYWIFITTGAGFTVGVLRWITKYPENLPGFFKEVNSCHVDPTWALHTVVVSAISIAGGANLGPEQAMGNLGGGLASIMADYMKFDNIEETQLTVLTGMSAAFGALFPTPLLGVLMIHELGNPPRGYMESTLLLSVAAVTSFLVFYQLEEKTWLERQERNYRLSVNWEFEQWQCGTAVVIGLISSASSMLILITIGLVKQILLRIQERCDRTGFLNGMICVATLGGFIIGVVAYVMPLTVGNGHQSTTSIIRNVETYSTHLLLCTCFGRALTLAISMNCGFIGGFVFPILAIGIIAGVIAHQQYDYLPLGMTVGCFLASMPSAICPMPFTLVGISCFLMFFGLQQTVPIFISCITAYLMFVGIGLWGALQARAQEANEANQQKKKGKKKKNLDGYKAKGKRFQ